MRRIASSLMFVSAVLFGCFLTAAPRPHPQSPSKPNATVITPLVLYDDLNGPGIAPAKWGGFAEPSFIGQAVRELSQGELSSGLRIYDSFENRYLNPSKWVAQWQCGGTVMECVREIQEEQLRLRVRAYGATDSNNGTQFGSSGLTLASNSATDIAADLTVRHSTAQACTTNPGFGGGGGHAQALIYGNFFNGGGGTSDDDVTAFLQLDRYSTYPVGMVQVGGFLHYQNQFFNNVDLGLVNIGERVRVELLWDQPNHRFVVRLFRPASRTLIEQVMPYVIADTTAAVSPFRNINANVFPANCVGTRTSAELEVLFNDVLTN